MAGIDGTAGITAGDMAGIIGTGGTTGPVGELERGFGPFLVLGVARTTQNHPRIYLSGTPASRMPSQLRSRPAR
jgi:hypothetical protein